jgi:hypothetical protein
MGRWALPSLKTFAGAFLFFICFFLSLYWFILCSLFVASDPSCPRTLLSCLHLTTTYDITASILSDCTYTCGFDFVDRRDIFVVDLSCVGQIVFLRPSLHMHYTSCCIACIMFLSRTRIHHCCGGHLYKCGKIFRRFVTFIQKMY